MSGQTVAAALFERLNGQLVRHRFQAATRRHLRSVIAALLEGHGPDRYGLDGQEEVP